MANRFIEAICETLDIKSPETIREEELEKIIKEHFGDLHTSKGWIKQIKDLIFEDLTDGYSEEDPDGER